MANINIFALGGQDENGKNSFVIENEDDIYVINTGLKIPINNLNGIDGIIPDFTYLSNKSKRIKGIFITHAHDEAYAALPWLLMDIKGLEIYASKFTLELIKQRIGKYNIGHKEYILKEIQETQKIGSLSIKSFSVANSIPGSLGFNFQTEDGDIIFMSNNTNEDLGIFGKTDLQKIKSESNNVLALITDSRYSHFKEASSEKKSVIHLIENTFKTSGKNERIIVGAYDEEIFTIFEVIQLAKKYNRPIISYGRVLDESFKEIRKQFKVDIPEFLDYKKTNRTSNAVVILSGTWSRLYDRFVRIANDDDVFMKFKKTDNVIMLCPPVNGMEVVYANSLDDVAKKSPNILDISDKDYFKLRSTGADINEIIKTIKPNYFIPTSGLYRYLVVATKIAIENRIHQGRNIVLQNGKIAHFINGELASQKSYIKKYGDVIIDGFGVGDVSYEVIKERKNLATGGLVIIALKLNRKSKKLIGKINIQILGLVVKNELKEAQELVEKVVIQKMDEQHVFDYRELQNSVRKRLRKVISRRFDKEPLVVITFYDI